MNKVFVYIMIGLGILLFIILLPVIIPLLGYLIKGFVKLCKMPLEAMERRRMEKLRTTVTDVGPMDLRKEKFNDIKVTENMTIPPGVNVNLNLNDIKEQSRQNNPYEDTRISVTRQSVIDSIESMSSTHTKNGESRNEQL